LFDPDEIRYVSLRIGNRDDLLFDLKFFTVFGLICQFGFPNLTRCDRLPQFRVEVFVLLVGVENPWIASNCLFSSVAG